MLELVRAKASDRKLRLFVVGCCRRAWRRLKDRRSREAVKVAELYADGLATDGELDEANKVAHEVHGYGEDTGVWAACCAVCDDMDLALGGADIARPQVQCDVLRCIFGPVPFRPITLEPAWQSSSTVVKLAQVIYEERRFADLPVLADALEDAGCDNRDILAHCRQPGEHQRGCWALDLLLGKE
jgi:hypothetical protein